MRCLVTGAAGFIGSHLVERLLDDGHGVVGIDNLATGRRSNLDTAFGNPRFAFHAADLVDQDTVQRLAEAADWIFHLGALADIVPSIRNPTVYYTANVSGTLSVLEAARHGGAKRFVYAASSSCYGIPDTYPTPETAELRSMYPYALTKQMGEELVLHWHQTYGLPTVSLRLFNVYGPRARTSGGYGAVLGVFLAQKLAGRPFTVVGDGTQTRDFTHVLDVCEAFVAAAESDIAGEVMNVGSGGAHSVNRLVELLGGDVVHIPKRPGEPDCTFADTEKIRSILGWRAKISLEQGIGGLLDGIEAFRDAPVWEPDGIAGATEDWFRYLGDGRIKAT